MFIQGFTKISTLKFQKSVKWNLLFALLATSSISWSQISKAEEIQIRPDLASFASSANDEQRAQDLFDVHTDAHQHLASLGNVDTGPAIQNDAAAPDVDAEKQMTDVFGSVAIPVAHLSIDRRWQDIAPYHAANLFGSTCKGSSALCNSNLMHVWTRLHDASNSDDKLELELLKHVNREVNAAVRYRSDTDNYGVADFWASPAEVAERGSADCKEFAVAKMWMLSALNVPASSMRIVVVVDKKRNLGHAVLVVNLHGTNLVLDNVNNQVLQDTEVKWYQPLYSMNTTGKWIHGVRQHPIVAQTPAKNSTQTKIAENEFVASFVLRGSIID